MRTLRLVGLSDDGGALVLALDDERFTLPLDDRLRAAVRGDARRLGRIDPDPGSGLPPRAIQARIRAGRTPEQVAAESGTDVERVVRYAHPVLQERAQMAGRARQARVRLAEGVPTVPLEQFVSERLRLIGGDVGAVDWDAHRGEDGDWRVTGTWRAGGDTGTTSWVLDVPGRTVSPADAATTDFAEGTRLVRVVPDVPHGPAPARGLPEPRTAAVPALPAAPRTTAADDGPAGRDGSPEPPVDDAGERALDPFDPAYLDEVADHDTVVLGSSGRDGEDPDPRVSIPAWEDIVFGVRRHR